MSVTRKDIEELMAICDARGEDGLGYACRRALGEDPDSFDIVARVISERRFQRACALDAAELAGCRQLRWNLQTGTRVAIYHAAEAGLDSSQGAYAVVCENHCSILSVDSLRAARRHAAGPLDWCADCADAALGRGR